MILPLKSEPPTQAFLAASFADSLVQQYVCQGGEARDLFVAFAGLVAGISEKIAMDCLIALDETIERSASAKNVSPVS
jgi:hypothetical protein